MWDVSLPVPLNFSVLNSPLPPLTYLYCTFTPLLSRFILRQLIWLFIACKPLAHSSFFIFVLANLTGRHTTGHIFLSESNRVSESSNRAWHTFDGESRILFIFTPHFHWKLAKRDPTPNTISEIVQTRRITAVHPPSKARLSYFSACDCGDLCSGGRGWWLCPALWLAEPICHSKQRPVVPIPSQPCRHSDSIMKITAYCSLTQLNYKQLLVPR